MIDELLQTYQKEHGNADLVQLIVQIQDQMNDFGQGITALRKQLSRVEIKSMQMCTCILFDFEGTLSREGLPFKTCVEINEFESKLKSEEYRTKMVRIQ